MITCGTDGDIRIWSGFEDYDPVQTCVGEWSLCVRQKRNQIQIGTDNNNVQLLTYPKGERDGILTRFTAHVNHIAVGKNHNVNIFFRYFSNLNFYTTKHDSLLLWRPKI